jgi:L-lysine exporter family protein LysE/ArgO
VTSSAPAAFAAGFALSLSLCLDLGLVNVAVLRTALAAGGRAAFVLGAGAAVGDLVYFALALAGASALLAFPAVRVVFWLGGTAVLLLLAARMLAAAWGTLPVDLEPGAAQPPRHGRVFAAGAALALASPSSILWFAAVGGSVIASFGGDRRALAPFALGFFAAGLVWSAAFAALAAALGRRLGPRLGRGLQLASALLFLALAAVVFVRGARAGF